MGIFARVGSTPSTDTTFFINQTYILSMPARLEDFVETKHITVNGECKKLKNWGFENQSYSIRGEYDPDVVLIFEDGTKEYVKNIPELRNC